MNVEHTVNCINIRQQLFALFVFVVRVTTTGTTQNLFDDRTYPAIGFWNIMDWGLTLNLAQHTNSFYKIIILQVSPWEGCSVLHQNLQEKFTVLVSMAKQPYTNESGELLS